MSDTPILIIDDSSTVRAEVQQLLQDNGHSVVEAQDGIEALERLKERPDIRVAVCDIHMPNMGGVEFLQTIRDSGDYAELRVVMLTTSGSPKVVHAARAAGAKAWLVKPFRPDMLVSVVAHLLERAPA